MSFNNLTPYAQILVGGTATLIVRANEQRLSLIIENMGSDSIYIGQDSNVTTAKGTLIVKGGILTEDSSGTKLYDGDYWAISSTSATVSYWERARVC